MVELARLADETEKRTRKSWIGARGKFNFLSLTIIGRNLPLTRSDLATATAYKSSKLSLSLSISLLLLLLLLIRLLATSNKLASS